VFIMGLNLVTVKLFGELEFWFALIKIIAIVVWIAVYLHSPYSKRSRARKHDRRRFKAKTKSGCD
jgi:L-asparagine transporter-like permease